MSDFKIPVGDTWAIVDERDYYELIRYRWKRSSRRPKTYAIRRNPSRYSQVFYMHRQILGFPDRKLMVDHINGDGLDNRRANLRLANDSQNQYNRKLNSNSKSGVKGVSWAPNEQRWRAMICAYKKRITLGYFKTKEEAAKAYDNAAKKLHGEFACTNEKLNGLSDNQASR